MPVIIDATNQVNLTDSSVVHKNKEVNGSLDLEVKAVKNFKDEPVSAINLSKLFSVYEPKSQ